MNPNEALHALRTCAASSPHAGAINNILDGLANLLSVASVPTTPLSAPAPVIPPPQTRAAAMPSLTSHRPQPPAPDTISDLDALRREFASEQRLCTAAMSEGRSSAAQTHGANASGLLDRIRRLEKQAAP